MHVVKRAWQSPCTRVIVRLRARMCLCVAVIAAVRLGNTYGHKWYNVHIVPYQIALYGGWPGTHTQPGQAQSRLREPSNLAERFTKSADQLNIRSAAHLYIRPADQFYIRSADQIYIRSAEHFTRSANQVYIRSADQFTRSDDQYSTLDQLG